MVNTMVNGLLLLMIAPYFAVQGQLYNMEDGNEEGLIYPCQGGPNGQWRLENANKYPGGPLEGTVLTSSVTSPSCLDTPEFINVSSDSHLFLMARFGYSQDYDFLTVWLIDKDENKWYTWFSMSSNAGWVQTERKLPQDVKTGQYIIRLWDSSSNESVSIRYFEITSENRTTTAFPPTETTESTTLSTETTESTTTSAETTTMTETTTVTDTNTDSTTLSTETTESPTTSAETTTMTETTTVTDTTTDSTTDDNSSSITSTDTTLTIKTTERTISMSTTTERIPTDTESTTFSDSTTEQTATTSTLTTNTDDSSSPTTFNSTESTSSISDSSENTSTMENTSTTTKPPPVSNDDDFPIWGFLLGLVVGAILVGVLFCCWWLLLLLLARRKPKDDKTHVVLPRLEVMMVTSPQRKVSIVGTEEFHRRRSKLTT